MADAQRREIGCDPRDVVEGEIARQLQPVGCSRNRGNLVITAMRRRSRRGDRPVAAPAAERSSQRRQAFSGDDRAQIRVKPPAPIGILPIGSRNVDLLDLAHDILELNHEQPTGCPREQAIESRNRRLPGRRRSFQQLLAPQELDQCCAIALAGAQRGIALRRRRPQVQAVAQGEVASRPVSGQSRQIMRADRDQRLARISVGRSAGGVGLLFEIEQAV